MLWQIASLISGKCYCFAAILQLIDDTGRPAVLLAAISPHVCGHTQACLKMISGVINLNNDSLVLHCFLLMGDMKNIMSLLCHLSVSSTLDSWDVKILPVCW